MKINMRDTWVTSGFSHEPPKLLLVLTNQANVGTAQNLNKLERAMKRKKNKYKKFARVFMNHKSSSDGFYFFTVYYETQKILVSYFYELMDRHVVSIDSFDSN